MAEKQELDFLIAMENDVQFVENFDQMKPLKQKTDEKPSIVQFYENFQLSDGEECDEKFPEVSQQVEEDVIDKLDVSSDENDVFLKIKFILW